MRANSVRLEGLYVPDCRAAARQKPIVLLDARRRFRPGGRGRACRRDEHHRAVLPAPHTQAVPSGRRSRAATRRPSCRTRARGRLGIGWHEHDAALFQGTERFFRPGDAASTLLMAQACPELQCRALCRPRG
ncbi:hypothetical protein [Variovorax sp. Root473]|uniref:hypothetical protein n=1 Tax=Variovorax sp. Root473 TaxID=1736541 RepID=UPI0009E988E5|nr:hypothetical protein [Variovorax sp. Root473]